MTTSSSNKLQDKFHNPLSEYINITVFAELKRVQRSIVSFANKIHLHESKQDFIIIAIIAIILKQNWLFVAVLKWLQHILPLQGP